MLVIIYNHSNSNNNNNPSAPAQADAELAAILDRFRPGDLAIEYAKVRRVFLKFYCFF